MLFQLYLMALVMVLVTAGLFVLSAQSAGLAAADPCPVGRGLCLAPHTKMAGSPSWLALIFALVADGTLFTALVFGAFYLWISACTVATRDWLAGFARVLSRVRPATPSAMNRACHRHTTGSALPDRRMISSTADGCGTDFGTPNMLLRRVAVTDNRLKPTTIFRHDVDDNSCSHDESLNCFGNLGIARMNLTTRYRSG
jgi:hypothetical protein